MSKKGYLSAEEYVAICQWLDMSTDDLIKFHKVQNRSTIHRWKTGKSYVSELACEKITTLFEEVKKRVDAALEDIYSQDKECQVVMIIYPESCSNMIFGLKKSNWPLAAYNACLQHIYIEASERGYNIGLIRFDPQSYLAFCAANNMKDCPQSRSLWANFAYKE